MCCARSSSVVAFLAIATTGIGFVLTGVSVAQQSPEIVDAIGGPYKIGRVTTTGGMIVQTILYNGSPIAIDYILPARGGGATASDAASPAAPTPSEFAGTVLSGEMSGNYFILHRARADRSTIHEIFLGGESIGNVAEAASTAGGRTAPDAQAGHSPSAGNMGRTIAPASVRRSAFSIESAGDLLVVHLVQPDGTRIRATSRSGGPLEQVIERRGDAVMIPVISVDRNSTDEKVPGANAVPTPRTPPLRPPAVEATQAILQDAGPSSNSAATKPLRYLPPKSQQAAPHQPVRAATRAAPVAAGDLKPHPRMNYYGAVAPAAQRTPPQRTVAPASGAPRPQIHRASPQSSTR